jgi:hypothetical protein
MRVDGERLTDDSWEMTVDGGLLTDGLTERCRLDLGVILRLFRNVKVKPCLHTRC